VSPQSWVAINLLVELSHGCFTATDRGNTVPEAGCRRGFRETRRLGRGSSPYLILREMKTKGPEILQSDRLYCCFNLRTESALQTAAIKLVADNAGEISFSVKEGTPSGLGVPRVDRTPGFSPRKIAK
jgi:hypothetical protein